MAWLVLGAFFVYVTVTVAAFVYLPWWQAILVSAATFVVIVLAAKFLVKYAIGRIGNLAKELFRTKSRVLNGATVQVHSVTATEPPDEVATETAEYEGEDADERAEAERARQEALNQSWYEIEATIFPDPKAAGPMTHWDIDDLRMVPAGTPPLDVGDDEDDGNDFGLYNLAVIEDGQASMPEASKFQGPRRLRFRVGVPKGTRELTFRYYFEQFGSVRLSHPALPG